MTTYYCNELSGVASYPQVQASGVLQGGGEVVFQSTITLASQLAGSVFILAQPQAGLSYLGCTVIVSGTLGSTTLAFSDTVSGNAYAAAATYTASAAVLPTTAALAFGPLTAQGQFVATSAAATLPSSGTVVVISRWATVNG